MLVSAVIADGPPRRVLEVIYEQRVEVIVPIAVLDEMRRVLEVKLGIDRGDVEGIVAELEKLNPSMPATPPTVQAVSGDPADDRILAAALSAGAGLLVSGDRRHLLPLGSHGGMAIVAPQAFLAAQIG